jgi:hypothetical protein
MAGAGYRLFATGEVLTAAQVNTYLQEQTVMVFASSAARTSALSAVLAEGMMSYLSDTNSVEVYNGSAWISVGSTGDITGVTAGIGISGGGTSGDVTVTNSMATAIDAKGDLIVGTGADTFSRLAVGATNGHSLQVDSTTGTGLKWASAAADKTFTLISTTATTSGSTVTISGLTGDALFIHLTGVSGTNANTTISLRLNGDSGVKYSRVGVYNEAGASYGVNLLGTNRDGLDTGNAVSLSFYSSSSTSGYSGVIQILGAASTTGIKPIIVSGGTNGDGSFNQSQFIGGSVYSGTTPAAITSVSFFLSSGTFDAGSISIYKG